MAETDDRPHTESSQRVDTFAWAPDTTTWPMRTAQPVGQFGPWLVERLQIAFAAGLALALVVVLLLVAIGAL